MTMPSANKVYNILAAGFMLAASAFAAGGARADNTTAQMDVTLTILPGCSFGFNTDGKTGDGSFNFGQVSDLNAGIDPKPYNLYVQCSKGSTVKYTITMDQGQHYANGTRNMQRDGATDKIPYKICLPAEAGGAAGCGTIWGDDTTLGKSYVASWDQSGNVKNIAFDLVVPPLKGGLPAGDYTDTVQLQIKW